MNILKRYGPQLHVEQYTGEQQKKTWFHFKLRLFKIPEPALPKHSTSKCIPTNLTAQASLDAATMAWTALTAKHGDVRD